MTVGLWAFADSSSCRAAAALPETIMFHYAVVPPSSRGSSTSSSSNTPPSPPVSPLLPASGVGVGGGYFRVGVATPPPSARATSTPGPCLPAGAPPSPADRRLHVAPLPPPLPPVGAVVDDDIPAHAASRAFRPSEILEEPESLADDSSSPPPSLRLRLSADGHLDAEAEPTPRWVRRLQLADDCHSANVLLQLERPRAGHHGVRCRVRAVRPLSCGQSVQLWFADELLACLGLPFLAPHNIQGEKRYVCHHCGSSFEFPNPLKLHLSLDCGRESVTELWRRLQRLQRLAEDSEGSGRGRAARPDSSAFRPYWASPGHGGSPSPSAEDASAAPSRLGTIGGALNGSLASGNASADSGVATLSRLSGSLNGSLSSNGSLNGSLNGSHGSPSLFGAFHHWALASPALRPGMPPLPLPLPIHQHPLLPRPLPPQAEPLGLGLGLGGSRVGDGSPNAHQASYHQHASDMETLVSNLGRSKQGHLCIYCGKVYSRKYGLKIHIRTHTGFKPLKCKYCLRPFGDPSNLNKHVRLHAEGDTPYKCELCGKVLVRRRDLERHVKSRHQDGEGLADWDPDAESDNDPDEDDDEDDVDVDVDVGDEATVSDGEQDPLHCNGSSMRKAQKRSERERGERERADIAIPTA